MAAPADAFGEGCACKQLLNMSGMRCTLIGAWPEPILSFFSHFAGKHRSTQATLQWPRFIIDPIKVGTKYYLITLVWPKLPPSPALASSQSRLLDWERCHFGHKSETSCNEQLLKRSLLQAEMYAADSIVKQSGGVSALTVRCRPSSSSNVAKPKFLRDPLLQAVRQIPNHSQVLLKIYLLALIKCTLHAQIHGRLWKSTKMQMHTKTQSNLIGHLVSRFLCSV